MLPGPLTELQASSSSHGEVTGACKDQIAGGGVLTIDLLHHRVPLIHEGSRTGLDLGDVRQVFIDWHVGQLTVESNDIADDGHRSGFESGHRFLCWNGE